MGQPILYHRRVVMYTISIYTFTLALVKVMVLQSTDPLKEVIQVFNVVPTIS